MSRINRVPDGILSLLGIKSVGRNPNDLNEQVTPTVDLAEFYYANIGNVTKRGFEQTVALANAGSYGQLEIPAGEAWRVWDVGSIITRDGVTSVSANFTTTVRTPELATLAEGTPITPMVDTSGLSSLNAINMSYVTQQWIGGVVFPSGTVFETLCNAVYVAGTVRIDTRVLCSVLNV